MFLRLGLCASPAAFVLPRPFLIGDTAAASLHRRFSRALACREVRCQHGARRPPRAALAAALAAARAIRAAAAPPPRGCCLRALSCVDPVVAVAAGATFVRCDLLASGFRLGVCHRRSSAKCTRSNMHSPPQVRGVTDAGLTPRPIRRVAVLGGGLMGSGIATALALAGVDVLLKEVNQQFLDVSHKETGCV